MSYNYQTEVISCNVCGSNETHLISRKGQHKLPISVVLCKNCGLGYLNPRWTEEGYLNFYQHDYDYYYRPNLEQKAQKTNKASEVLLKRFENGNWYPEKVEKILDIGCGEGHTLKLLREKFNNAEFFAIEPSKEARKILTQASFQVLTDDANTNWEESANKYDVIILRHVLEHFLDPLKILKKINAALSNDGIVYIAVPNNLNPIQNLEKIWLRVVHTYYFNKYSLKNILSLAGLEIVTLIEGDQYSKGEVFLIAKKANKEIPLEFSQKHFEVQKEVFEVKLKQDKQLSNKLKNLFKKAVRKITP